MNTDREISITTKCGHCAPEDSKKCSPSSLPEIVPLKALELDSHPMCRICYSGSSSERLLNPCKCKGTIEHVHRNCLEKWLESNNCETCELCHHQFTTRRTRKSIWEWWRQAETRYDRRNFIGDLICFIFLTPLGIATFWLCAEGAIYYQKVKSSTLESVALTTLSLFLVLAYVTWFALCTRYHLMICSRWRNDNYSVRIVDGQTARQQVSSDEAFVITVPPQGSDQSSLISTTAIRESPVAYSTECTDNVIPQSPQYSVYISHVSTV